MMFASCQYSMSRTTIHFLMKLKEAMHLTTCCVASNVIRSQQAMLQLQFVVLGFFLLCFEKEVSLRSVGWVCG